MVGISTQASSLQQQLKTPWHGLRSDLRIYPGPSIQGQRSWVVEDPLSGQHFQLGAEEGEFLLQLSRQPTVDQALVELLRLTPFRPSLADVIGFVEMLQQEGLAKLPAIAAAERGRHGSDNQPSLTQKLLHGYLYFRIPLLRPDRFLTRTYPSLRWLWSAGMRAFYLLAGLLGLLLMLQQHEHYLDSGSYLFTPQGAVGFALSLALLKIGHEFSHAYVAKSYGLRVRRMGFAFIVLWPVLYTDTSDAWKLNNPQHRLMISAAGVLFELVVAGLALLFWALLPDGAWRSLMFFLSSTSLLSSLLINLNPFMRFDGYYLLMDWWGVDNLQPRAFALLRYRLRRWLFDWQAPAPERHAQEGRLVLYAALTTLYRIFLALVVALAVYHLFFPALGILLLLIELWLFLLRPFWVELREVIKHRQFIGSRAALQRTLIGSVLLLMLVTVPMPTLQRLPAVQLYREAQSLRAPAAGQLIEWRVEQGQWVIQDQLLARLRDQQLDRQLQQRGYDLKVLQQRLHYLGSSGEQGSYRQWLLVEEQRLKTELQKLQRGQQLLEIRAGREGRIVDLNERLRSGISVSKGGYLLTIADPTEQEVKAYLHEELLAELPSLQGFATWLVLPGGGWQRLQAEQLSPLPVQKLANNSLYDYAGGPLVAQRQGNSVKPKEAHFALQLAAAEPLPPRPHGERVWVWIGHRGSALVWRLAKWFINQLW